MCTCVQCVHVFSRRFLNSLPSDILLNVFLAIAVDNLGDIEEADDRDHKLTTSPKINSSAKNSIVCDVKVCIHIISTEL